MIERLDQITIAQFIDMTCGDCKMLGEGTPEQLSEIRSRLMSEYRSIVDPAGVSAMLTKKESMAKIGGKIAMLRICENMLKMDCYDDVAETLRIYGAVPKSNDAIGQQIFTMLNTAEYELKRCVDADNETPPPTEDEVRKGYASEIAGVMSYFKMPLDIYSVNAMVYANLIVQANRQIKAKMSAVKQ